MSKLKLIVLALSLALAGMPGAGLAEEPAPPTAKPADDEKTAEEREAYLKELDEKLEKMKKHVQQIREEQQREELAAPLAERALSKVTDGDYAGAIAALDDWEHADPTEQRVTPLRGLVRQMAQEEDEKRRTELLREYLDVMTSRQDKPAPSGS